MGYIVAVHVPIAGLALLPLLFGFPLVLTPIHIAFLEMVIDPACSIVFEAEPDEADLMRRPPRSPQSRILPARLAGWSVIQGTLAFAAVAASSPARWRGRCRRTNCGRWCSSRWCWSMPA